jgi:hypothetical protein
VKDKKVDGAKPWEQRAEEKADEPVDERWDVCENC